MHYAEVTCSWIKKKKIVYLKTELVWDAKKTEEGEKYWKYTMKVNYILKIDCISCTSRVNQYDF